MQSTLSGKPKGWAFLSYGQSEAADEAVSKLAGHQWEGRKLKVVRPTAHSFFTGASSYHRFDLPAHRLRQHHRPTGPPAHRPTDPPTHRPTDRW